MLKDREYIRRRLQGIQMLGLDNPTSAGKVLEQVWMLRDTSHATGQRLQSWQDVMQLMGEGQILV